MLIEIRRYLSTADRIDALHRRFEEATLPAFARAGIGVVGLFTPVDEPHAVVYVTAFPDEATRAESWARFNADEQWLADKAESERDGPLIVERSAEVLTTTPYSPAWAAPVAGGSAG